MEGLAGVFAVMVYEYKVEKASSPSNFDSTSAGSPNK
ncbi:Uncharacterised protein [Yersinia enterocolitica]|nr:Uncharacterised protein [Yersinia enterocolitica]CNF04544.1 Uncharacterised protein [Yersinia enterocolitica]CNK05778.1 Uncharacterised protein [Yersinia enterocolitica]